MGETLLRTLGVGVLAALGLIIASDLPALGAIINLPGLNWLIWIGVWAWLADRFVAEARPSLALTENPSIPAMGAGALVGLVSGLTGQLIQIIIQGVFVAVFASRAAQTGSMVPVAQETGAAFSMLGAMIAVFVYPTFGAFWGGLFGLIWGMRVRQARAPVVVAPSSQVPQARTAPRCSPFEELREPRPARPW